MIDFSPAGSSVSVTAPLLPPVALSASEQKSGDFSLGKVTALFILLLTITSLPVVLHPWPPSSNYINHLARMQVIANIGTDPDLARFYEIDWQVIPNLMMDLII